MNEKELTFYCKDCSNEHARKVREKRRKDKGIPGYEDRQRTVNGVKQKLCVSCKQWKSEIEFHRRRAAKDGLNSQCKECKYKPTKSPRRP